MNQRERAVFEVLRLHHYTTGEGRVCSCGAPHVDRALPAVNEWRVHVAELIASRYDQLMVPGLAAVLSAVVESLEERARVARERADAAHDAQPHQDAVSLQNTRGEAFEDAVRIVKAAAG